MNIRFQLPVVCASVALALLFAATPLLAQSKGGGGRATPPGKEAPVSTSPNDPTSHNPMRPNQYDIEYSRLGSHSEVEAMLKAGNEARAATPAQLEEAEKDYLRAAEIDPKEARAYVGLGNVYAAQNRVEDTIKSFEKALELKPKLAEAHFNLGMVLAATGKKDEAAKHCQALDSLNKDWAKKLNDFIAQH